MARTAVPYTNVSPGSIVVPTGTTIDPTNDHVINGADTEKTVLVISNTAASAHIVIVKAGVFPVAVSSGQGDLSLSIAAGATGYFGPFESSRFKRNDGSVWLDFETGHTGTVTALSIPRGI